MHLMLFFISLISFNIIAQDIPPVETGTPLTSELQNQLINGVNSYNKTINNNKHFGNLGGSGYKTNYNIASFGTTTESTSSNKYIHIKVNIKPSEISSMYRFNLQGHAYGPSKVIDVTFVGYSYNGSIVSLGYLDPSGYFGQHQYISSDGYLVLRLYAANPYFLSFVVNTTQVGNGGLYDKDDILDIIINSGTNL